MKTEDEIDKLWTGFRGRFAALQDEVVAFHFILFESAITH
jgi:hypothetical protein